MYATKTCAAYIDTKGAFDFVTIPTLISRLISLHIPHSFAILFHPSFPFIPVSLGFNTL